MSRIELVVSDLDGTLLTGEKAVTAPVQAAVATLRASGVAFSIISARPPSGMLWVAQLLGLAAPMGGFNGGTLLWPDGTPIATHTLPPPAYAKALALLDRPGVMLWAFHKGVWHAKTLDGIYTPREMAATKQEPTLTPDLALLAEGVDKLIAISSDLPLMAQLESELGTALSGQACVSLSQNHMLDITAMAANKGEGVAAIARHVGVDMAHVAVLGDQRNDMAMFARAGLAIAMGQASPAVQAAAHVVTTPNNADGVAHAIETIIMPRNED